MLQSIDYYTGSIFKCYTHGIGFPICAGGRYDNLVEALGGKQTPVVGFGIGIERILLYLENKGIELIDDSRLDVYVASNTDNENYVIRFVRSLRNKGFGVESNLMDRSVKSQFKYADKINAKFVITIGDDEINENKLSVKNMSTGEQIKIWSNDIAEYLHQNV